MNLPKRGFSLIELLIVIAVIGMLAMLILVGLNRLRRDAFDARIQSDVRQMRVLAESAYDTDGASYVNWSQAPVVLSEVTSLLADIDEAHGDSNMTVIRETQAKDFCVSAPLHPATGGYVCIDATGVFKITTDHCPDEPIDGDPLLCPTT